MVRVPHPLLVASSLAFLFLLLFALFVLFSANALLGAFGSSFVQCTLFTSGVLLHRIYGISFESPELGREWEAKLADAERRDHRTIGARQNLIMFHELAA